MAKAPSGEWDTLALRRVWTAASPTYVGLVFETDSHGTFALPLDERGISVLREQLAAAEVALSQKGGHA
ncbi:MAG: hypothetical protein RJS97_02470 [Parvibaculaceae bacterium]